MAARAAAVSLAHQPDGQTTPAVAASMAIWAAPMVVAADSTAVEAEVASMAGEAAVDPTAAVADVANEIASNNENGLESLPARSLLNH